MIVSESFLRIVLLASLCLALGCFSTSQSTPPKTWTVDAAHHAPHPPLPEKYSATRLGAVTVMVPFDKPSFSVRRADGTLAEDPANRFAAAPAALLRAPTLQALARDGRFGAVLNTSSIASASAAVELTVSEISLDCREEGARRATTSLRLDVISTGGRGGRTLVASASGVGTADAQSGDYSAAFTAAFDEAIQNALSKLKSNTPNADVR